MKRLLFGLMILPAYLAQAKDIKVCATCGFRDIPAALNAARDGDVIRIAAGTYKANNITIRKQVTLTGENYPVLDAGGKEECLTVLADHVTIQGIEFRNTARGSMRDFAGIRVFKVRHIQILNNRLKNTFFGIYLSDVDDARVAGNLLTGEAPDQTSSGNGIHLWRCSGITIHNNTISGHRDGIYFEFAKQGNIAHNTSTHNHRYGLHFMFSDGNVFTRNTFAWNGTGVAVMYSKNIDMLHNVFRENWGSAAYGMLLKDINDSHIRGNLFEKNTAAMYFEGSNRVKTDSNRFIKNGWAIKLLASCQQDTFTANNFSGNTFDVSTNGTLYLNYFTRNYWQKYEGYDINHDAVGDVPHRPVSLYCMMVEKMPYFILLLRSFIIDILDTAERNIPAIIPENLLDAQPLMKELELNDTH